MRFGWVYEVLLFGVLLAGCRLGPAPAPVQPDPQPCPSLDEAMASSRQALDDGWLRPLGEVVEQLLVDGALVEPLRSALGDTEEVEAQLDGPQFSGLVAGVIELLQYRLPLETIDLLGQMGGRPASDLALLADALEFVAETAERRAAMTPIRTLFVACADGREVAGFLAGVLVAPGACGADLPALRCLIDDLAILLRDPGLRVALRSLEFEGSEGRHAGLALIKVLMNSSAQPAFDPAGLRSMVADLFADQLSPEGLAAIDRTLLGLSALLEDSVVHGYWRGIVLCVERHDSEQRIAGLTLDLLLSDTFAPADLAALLDGIGPLLSSRPLLEEWADLSGYMFRHDSVRARVIGALRPLITPAVFGYLAPTAITLLRDGVAAELFDVLAGGLSCATD
jgi:hypothetical protein